MKDFIGISLVVATALAGFTAAWQTSAHLIFKKAWLALLFNLPFFLVASILTFIASTFVEYLYWGASGMYDVELLFFLLVGLVSAVLVSACNRGDFREI